MKTFSPVTNNRKSNFSAATNQTPDVSRELTLKNDVRADVPRLRAVIPLFRADVPRLRGAVPRRRAVAARLRAVVPLLRGAVPLRRGAVPRHYGTTARHCETASLRGYESKSPRFITKNLVCGVKRFVFH